MQAKPITLKGLTDALKIGGLSSAEMVKLIQERGVDFQYSADNEAALKAAGANSDVLAAVWVNYRGAPTTDAGTKPPVTTGNGTPPATMPPAITSIRQVKKIYIEKMSNDLDVYIKTEISRQMPNQLVVVLVKGEADAVMTGTSTNKNGSVTITDLRGTVQLWTGEANDKNLFVHGGEKVIAGKIVGDLKRSMEEPAPAH